MAERDVTALPVLGTRGRVAGVVAEIGLPAPALPGH